MRKYNKNTNELEAAVCNCCGKNMKIQNGMLLDTDPESEIQE